MEQPIIDFEKIQTFEQCYAIKHSSDTSISQKLHACYKQQQIINAIIEIEKNGGIISDADKIEMDRILNEEDNFLNAVIMASDTSVEEKQIAKNIQDLKHANKLTRNTPLNITETNKSQLDANIIR